MLKKRCLVIPAIKKNAVIPDQLVKKLAGKTLIQRALDTARAVAGGRDILVVTDSDEIRLICERNGVGCAYNPAHYIASLDIVAALRPELEKLAERYERIVIYRASAPLITARDIEDAYARFVSAGSDCLVTVKSVKYRLWEDKGGDIDALLFNDAERESTAYAETRALFMLRADALTRGAGKDGGALKTVPYFLHDRSVEITSHMDWWLCEKILQSRHVVFVVAGYPAIGMGHVYRSLMLANEMPDHRVSFLCTRESELAAANIALRDYRTRVQGSGDLASEVLALRPDLVINDLLDSDPGYMAALKNAGLPVVNFEDEGEGAALADLVVNALNERNGGDSRLLCGHRYFCLRDEFVQARRNQFRAEVKKVLLSFGGADPGDYTRMALEAVFPLCQERGIRVSIVAGPGYAHKEALEKRIAQLNESSPLISFTHTSNAMSREMEGADMALCSAGRTVYELAHMRIPAVVLSQHEREDNHAFARRSAGFIRLNAQRARQPGAIAKAFETMLDAELRRTLFSRMERFNFGPNKSRVVGRILGLLAQ